MDEELSVRKWVLAPGEDHVPIGGRSSEARPGACCDAGVSRFAELLLNTVFDCINREVDETRTVIDGTDLVIDGVETVIE